jgi:hypothetical protein
MWRKPKFLPRRGMSKTWFCHSTPTCFGAWLPPLLLRLRCARVEAPQCAAKLEAFLFPGAPRTCPRFDTISFMNRRAFLATLAAGLTRDPERLLWVPGRRLISIPKPRPVGTATLFNGPEELRSGDLFEVFGQRYRVTEATPTSLGYFAASLSPAPTGAPRFHWPYSEFVNTVILANGLPLRPRLYQTMNVHEVLAELRREAEMDAERSSICLIRPRKRAVPRSVVPWLAASVA